MRQTPTTRTGFDISSAVLLKAVHKTAESFDASSKAHARYTATVVFATALLALDCDNPHVENSSCGHAYTLSCVQAIKMSCGQGGIAG